MRRLAAVLIVAGLLLSVGLPAAVNFADRYVARTRSAQVERWVKSTRTQAKTPRKAPVIKPGRDGYLLEIPKIGVRVIVRELEPAVFFGRNTPLLRRLGVGQLPYTKELGNVSPGQNGTAAITGHRTTSGAPFRNIHRLAAGDVIIIRKGQFEQRWNVISSITVLPDAIEAIRSHMKTRRLALLACNPPFSARERLIVYAVLTDDRRGAASGP